MNNPHLNEFAFDMAILLLLFIFSIKPITHENNDGNNTKPIEYGKYLYS